MTSHLRRWGAVYLLLMLFVGSWAGQLVAQAAEFTSEQGQHGQPFTWSEFWPTFWAATLENWQSEFLQLIWQAVIVVGYAHVVFRKGTEDIDRVEAKVDRLLARLPDR